MSVSISFTQTKFPIQLTFEIEEDGVVFHYATIFKDEKYKVYFDTMNPNPIETTIFPRIWFGIASVLFFALLYVLQLAMLTEFDTWNILYVALPLIYSLIMIYFKYQKYIVIESTYKPILFLKDIPNKEKQDDFINQIKTAQKAYYLNSNVMGVTISKLDELERLAHLKNISALTETEFDELKKIVIEQMKMKNNFFGDSSIN